MPVRGDERCIERLGKSHVHRVVRREVVAKAPRAFQQLECRIARDRERKEIVDGLARPLLVDPSPPFAAAYLL